MPGERASVSFEDSVYGRQMRGGFGAGQPVQTSSVAPNVQYVELGGVDDGLSHGQNRADGRANAFGASAFSSASATSRATERNADVAAARGLAQDAAAARRSQEQERAAAAKRRRVETAGMALGLYQAYNRALASGADSPDGSVNDSVMDDLMYGVVNLGREFSKNMVINGRNPRLMDGDGNGGHTGWNAETGTFDFYFEGREGPYRLTPQDLKRRLVDFGIDPDNKGGGTGSSQPSTGGDKSGNGGKGGSGSSQSKVNDDYGDVVFKNFSDGVAKLLESNNDRLKNDKFLTPEMRGVLEDQNEFLMQLPVTIMQGMAADRAARNAAAEAERAAAEAAEAEANAPRTLNASVNNQTGGGRFGRLFSQGQEERGVFRTRDGKQQRLENGKWVDVGGGDQPPPPPDQPPPPPDQPPTPDEPKEEPVYFDPKDGHSVPPRSRTTKTKDEFGNDVESVDNSAGESILQRTFLYTTPEHKTELKERMQNFAYSPAGDALFGNDGDVDEFFKALQGMNAADDVKDIPPGLRDMAASEKMTHANRVFLQKAAYQMQMEFYSQKDATNDEKMRDGAVKFILRHPPKQRLALAKRFHVPYGYVQNAEAAARESQEQNGEQEQGTGEVNGDGA